MTELYREQYCSKHDQHYADFLPQCPICLGEMLATTPIGTYGEQPQPKPRPKLAIRPKLVKRVK